MHHRSPLQSPQHDFPSGSSDAGVYQLSRQHAAVVRRQQQPHLVELRALGLVHGHGEGAVVLREGGGMEDTRDVRGVAGEPSRSEEHTSELQSLMRISYAVFCLKKKNTNIEAEQEIT